MNLSRFLTLLLFSLFLALPLSAARRGSTPRNVR